MSKGTYTRSPLTFAKIRVTKADTKIAICERNLQEARDRKLALVADLAAMTAEENK